jgi:hypothetical protein
MTRSEQESPVLVTSTPGLMRRGLETGPLVPRQSSTLLKTASALGLNIPQSLQLRADQLVR